MPHPAGEYRNDIFALEFDRRLKLEFEENKITSDAGLLAYRAVDGDAGIDRRRGGEHECLPDRTTGTIIIAGGRPSGGCS